jgi:hypothetical protein
MSASGSMNTEMNVSDSVLVGVGVGEFNSKLSVYIPILDDTVSEALICQVFMSEGLGVVERVDFIHNRLGKKQAFVHFVNWNNTLGVRALHMQILDPNQRARLVYDTERSKFWPLLPNRNPLDTPRTEIISVLQNKIIALENKLNQVNFMGAGAGAGGLSCDVEYGMPSKRPRSENSLENLVIRTSPPRPLASPEIVRQNGRGATPLGMRVES